MVETDEDKEVLTLTKSAEKRHEAIGPVFVYRHWCKACGICIAFCPRNVFDADGEGYAVVARPEQCTHCRLCEFLCPDFAISVTKR